MHMYVRRPLKCFSFPFLIFLSAICTLSLPARSAPEVRASTAIADDLTTENLYLYLQNFSKANNTAIVVENWHSLPSSGKDTLSIETNYSLEKLSEIAERYDYSVETVDKVIVLKRLYSTSDSLPSLTLEECDKSLQDIVRLLSKYSSGMESSPVGNPITNRFIRSLTPEQVASLSQKNGGLSLLSLNSLQQSQVRQMSYYFYLGGTEETARTVARHLRDATHERMQLGWHTDSNAIQFGYYTTEAVTGTVAFRPLRTADGKPVAWNRMVDFRGMRYGAETPTAGAMPVATKEITVAIPRLSTSMDILNRSETGDRRYEVDPTLADKKIVVIGEHKATPLRLQRAIAHTYGLRIQSKTGLSTYTITRPIISTATVVAELRGKILDALPAPILRVITNASLHSQPRSEYQRGQSSLADVRNPENLKVIIELRKQQLQGRERQRHLYTLRNLALDQLQKAINDPSMKKKVPISELSRETKSALAFILMTDLFGESSQLTRETPFYVSQFENVILKGGPTSVGDSSDFFKLEFAHKRADGNVINDAAGFITRLPSENKP